MDVASPRELEERLNDCHRGGEASLWSDFNVRLRYFAQKPPLQYSVKPWPESVPRLQDPSVIKTDWRDDEYDVHLDPLFFVGDSHPYLFVLRRALITATVLPFITKITGKRSGSAVFCLSDTGNPDAISFSAREEPAQLIPDAQFMWSFAYEWFRVAVSERWKPWRDRERIAVWRGDLNGVATYRPTDDWSWLPRAHLCALAETIPRSSFVDAKLTGISQYVRNEFPDATTAAGRFSGERIEPVDLIAYRYMIDIDGWANSWSGLFRKLLTGSTVLKVASQRGFRQWYYERLEPWVHYVPVRSDLSDFNEALDFVLSNDRDAEAIGAAGRQLALSLSLDAEIFGMAPTI